MPPPHTQGRLPLEPDAPRGCGSYTVPGASLGLGTGGLVPVICMPIEEPLSALAEPPWTSGPMVASTGMRKSTDHAYAQMMVCPAAGRERVSMVAD